MRISDIELVHFRGVQKLHLPLHPQLNVFSGANGSGKSSFLDASALSLSWLVNRIKSSAASGRPILDQDIKNGENSAHVSMSLEVQGEHFEWCLVRRRKGHSKKLGTSTLTELSLLANEVQNTITADQRQANIPLFAYYPVNRAVLDIPLRIRGKHHFGLLEAYDEALNGGASFRQFFEWFREREDLENETRRDQQSLFQKANSFSPDSQLEAVRQALETLMPDFKNFTVRRSPLRMEVMKNGKQLSVNQLSDGEKCLMAMVGDLARRMAIANPMRDKPLEGDGVVLIDEIDLHLHPRWQRMIVPRLMDLFPNCQFIISTHSPHVLTHVQPESIHLLKETGEGVLVVQPSEAYGKTVERVLEDVMGLETTRPDSVDKRLRHLFDVIHVGELSTARSVIDELRSEIGADPELAKAAVLIRRKEMIGR